MGTTERLCDRVKKFLDAEGIETAVVLVRDPDNSDVVAGKRGDALWCIGACRAMEQELRDGWVKPRCAHA